MKNLPYKVGEVVFMTEMTTSKGKGKRGTVTKITKKFNHHITGYCLHKYIAVLPITGPAQPAEPAKPAEPTATENQAELIRDLSKLVLKLTVKISSIEDTVVSQNLSLKNEITCLRGEVRNALLTT